MQLRVTYSHVIRVTNDLISTSGSFIAQAAFLHLDTIPNTYRKPRPVNSSRLPRVFEVIGDSVTSSGAGSGLGGWFSICHDSAFLFILSCLANVCTPLPFNSATDEVVGQTFYFNCILARKYDYHSSDSNNTSQEMKDANFNI